MVELTGWLKNAQYVLKHLHEHYMAGPAVHILASNTTPFLFPGLGVGGQ